uniref:Uncharacterized protein n=1 Tax=Triticum urartu TaxID=4572 RepID=A0A8R7JXN6_TRIUA
MGQGCSKCKKSLFVVVQIGTFSIQDACKENSSGQRCCISGNRETVLVPPSLVSSAARSSCPPARVTRRLRAMAERRVRSQLNLHQKRLALHGGGTGRGSEQSPRQPDR